MRLIGFDPTLSTPELQQLSGDPRISESEVPLITTQEGLRMLRSGIREAHEELRGNAFSERVGITPERAAKLLTFLREISVAIASQEGQYDSPGGKAFWTTDLPASTSRGTPSSGSLMYGHILLAVDRVELTACNAMFYAALEELEEWEFEIRFGFTEREVREAILDLKNILGGASA